jgi:hypothetical protein
VAFLKLFPLVKAFINGDDAKTKRNWYIQKLYFSYADVSGKETPISFEFVITTEELRSKLRKIRTIRDYQLEPLLKSHSSLLRALEEREPKHYPLMFRFEKIFFQQIRIQKKYIAELNRRLILLNTNLGLPSPIPVPGVAVLSTIVPSPQVSSTPVPSNPVLAIAAPTIPVSAITVPMDVITDSITNVAEISKFFNQPDQMAIDIYDRFCQHKTDTGRTLGKKKIVLRKISTGKYEYRGNKTLFTAFIYLLSLHEFLNFDLTDSNRESVFSSAVNYFIHNKENRDYSDYYHKSRYVGNFKELMEWVTPWLLTEEIASIQGRWDEIVNP